MQLAEQNFMTGKATPFRLQFQASIVTHCSKFTCNCQFTIPQIPRLYCHYSPGDVFLGEVFGRPDVQKLLSALQFQTLTLSTTSHDLHRSCNNQKLAITPKLRTISSISMPRTVDQRANSVTVEVAITTSLTVASQ